MASTQLTKRGTDPQTDPTETYDLWIMGTVLCSFRNVIRVGTNQREEKKTEFPSAADAEQALAAEVVRLQAAGFVLREAKKPAAKPAPSKARAAGPAPRWLVEAPDAIQKQRKKLKAAAKKVELGHRFDEIATLMEPGIDLVAKKAKSLDPRKVVSRIGGEPDLPSGHAWPRLDGAPLKFVAQIVVADVVDLDLAQRLPRDGVLSFFAQLDPNLPEYCERCVVECFRGALVRAPAPAPSLVIANAALFTPKPRLTIPPGESPVIEALGLSSAEQSAYHDDLFLDAAGAGADGPRHALLGWPTALTHHGIEGKRFLAQLDSDAQIGLEMGDFETLRFYIEGDVVSGATLKTAVCTLGEA